MLKDLHQNIIENIAVAIIQDEIDKSIWDVYLLNLKGIEIKNVLITSKGYGKIKGEQKTTSSLRFFFDDIQPQSFVK